MHLLDSWFLLVFYYVVPTVNKDNNKNNNNTKYAEVNQNSTCIESPSFEYETRKATGFKSLRLTYWEINRTTPKCQIDFWTKLSKKGIK